MIEDKCRFEDKIRNIQTHTGVCLESEKEGFHLFITDNSKINNEIGIKKKRRKRDKFIHEATKALPYLIAKKLLK